MSVWDFLSLQATRVQLGTPQWPSAEGQAPIVVSFGQYEDVEIHCSEACMGHWIDVVDASLSNLQTMAPRQIHVDFNPLALGCPLCVILSDILQKWSLLDLRVRQNCTLAQLSLDARVYPYAGIAGELRFTVSLGSQTLGSITKRNKFTRCISDRGVARPNRELPDRYRDRFGNTVDLFYFRGRIANCILSHTRCNRIAKSRNRMEIYLIDTKTLSLVVKTTDVEYVALSYVNGGASMLKSTVENVESLLKDLSLWANQDIAQVIQDAMLACPRLNYRYLWVDMLCILQDDITQKHDQILNMDTVYRSAALTLVAFSSNNASDGLPGVHMNSRIPTTTYFNSDRVEPSLLATPTRPSLFSSTSTYETRGWTFQERLLSTRCLYFTSHQVILQCCEELHKEENLNEEYELSVSANNHELGFAFQNPLQDLGIFDHNYPIPIGILWNKYTELVLLYTPRKFSYDEDIINAFSGIMNTIKQYWNTEFIQCLPAHLLEWALFWFPSGECSRRIVDYGQRKGRRVWFPSWSWTGWNGPMLYKIEDETNMHIRETSIDSIAYLGDNQSIYLNKSMDFGYEWEVTEGVSTQANPFTTVESLETPLPTYRESLLFSSMTRPIWDLSFHDSSSSLLSRSDVPVIGIFDKNENQCGVLIDSLERVGGFLRDVESAISLKMILLSSARPRLSKTSGFTVYLPHKKYIEPFNDHYSNLEPGNWKMCNFLLIHAIGDQYERIAAGILHEKAWSEGDLEPDNIRLI